MHSGDFASPRPPSREETAREQSRRLATTIQMILTRNVNKQRDNFLPRYVPADNPDWGTSSDSASSRDPSPSDDASGAGSATLDLSWDDGATLEAAETIKNRKDSILAKFDEAEEQKTPEEKLKKLKNARIFKTIKGEMVAIMRDERVQLSERENARKLLKEMEAQLKPLAQMIAMALFALGGPLWGTLSKLRPGQRHGTTVTRSDSMWISMLLWSILATCLLVFLLVCLRPRLRVLLRSTLCQNLCMSSRSPVLIVNQNSKPFLSSNLHLGLLVMLCLSPTSNLISTTRLLTRRRMSNACASSSTTTWTSTMPLIRGISLAGTRVCRMRSRLPRNSWIAEELHRAPQR
jgi:hypothetical protein